MPRNSRVTTAPPAVTVVEITEPTAVNAGIELIDQDAVQLQPLPLRARRVIVRLDAATVVLHATNRRLRTSTRVHEGWLAYVTFGPHATGTVNGLPVRPGLMLAAGPETEARFVVEAGWESLTFLVSPEDIRAHLASRQREHEFHVPHGVEALQADPDGSRRLFDWGKRLTTTAARQSAIFNEGRNERAAARVELFETLLPVLGVAEQFEPTRSDRTRQARSDIVTIAEEYALSRVGDHLSVTDLCRAAGVSERTMEYAFREVMGLAPMAYLIRLRLHRVRQGLLAGTPRSTTVSAEALNWGFWHFGEFSRAYKDCFGELPSETLRRPPDRSR
ncbi:MAG TPA: helix-turn-helix domain-containing protein [Vicinamibacterales bacterium]|nr:helix-turn-helix domain-containing protein [Vicinamibacterales bacterium]